MRQPLLLRSCGLALAVLAFGCSRGGGGGGVTPTLQFGPPGSTSLGLGGATGLALTDADGDGSLDAMVVHEAAGALALLPGLANPVRVPLAAAAVLAVGDLNGDRRPDAITAGRNLGVLAVNRGTGTGFLPPSNTTLVDGARQILLGDFDGDGLLDVVVAHANSARCSVLLGDGTGGFRAIRDLVLPAVPTAMAVADFNRDGRLDLAVAAGSQVVVLLQTVGGTFAVPRTTPVAALSGPLTVGDLDGDGDPDLLALTQGGGAMVPLINDGGGSCTALPAVALPVIAREVLLTDLDLDGNLDAVLASGTQVLVAYGTGSAFGELQSLGTSGAAVSQLALADLDGDGHVDVVFLVGGESIGTLRNPKLTPAGLRIYGTGTPGCGGAAVLTGNSLPSLGNAGFRLICVNAPPNTFGMQLLGGPIDEVGTDLYGLAFKLHIGTGVLVSTPVLSDASGFAYSNSPVPARSDLLSTPVYAQMLWQERAGGCSPSPVGVVSSRGLHITFQP